MLNKYIKYFKFYLGGKYNVKQNNQIVLGTLILSN